MKKLLITAMALSCFALSYGQKKVEKQIIGKWCNPYTYKSTGEDLSSRKVVSVLLSIFRL